MERGGGEACREAPLRGVRAGELRWETFLYILKAVLGRQHDHGTGAPASRPPSPIPWVQIGSFAHYLPLELRPSQGSKAAATRWGVTICPRSGRTAAGRWCPARRTTSSGRGATWRPGPAANSRRRPERCFVTATSPMSFSASDRGQTLKQWVSGA